MIVGALEIMRGVRGTLVHPLLLPGAQGPDLLGYIVIAYEDRCGLFDILFVRGSRIEECACLHRELRGVLSEGAVRAALASSRLKCRVYLYALTRQVYNSFLSTFRCAPSLNVEVDGLSRKQVAALASGIQCANGILEVVRPAFPFPSITLFRFHSREELLDQAERIRGGRMLAYDVELNAVMGDRSRADTGDVPGGGSGSRAPDGGITPAGEEHNPDDHAPSPAPAAEAAEPAAAPPPPPVTAAPRPEGRREERVPLTPDGRLLIAAFGRALEEFERAGREICGSRIERNLPHILGAVFPGAGAFEERAASVAEALKVLGVFTHCVAQAAPIGRRSLRRAARDIVKDMHQNHQKLLYRCGVESQVRECYRVLAGLRPGTVAAA